MTSSTKLANQSSLHNFFQRHQPLSSASSYEETSKVLSLTYLNKRWLSICLFFNLITAILNAQFIAISEFFNVCKTEKVPTVPNGPEWTSGWNYLKRSVKSYDNDAILWTAVHMYSKLTVTPFTQPRHKEGWKLLRTEIIWTCQLIAPQIGCHRTVTSVYCEQTRVWLQWRLQSLAAARCYDHHTNLVSK